VENDLHKTRESSHVTRKSTRVLRRLWFVLSERALTCCLSCQSESSLVVCLVRARAHLLFCLVRASAHFLFVLSERALTSCLSCQSERSLLVCLVRARAHLSQERVLLSFCSKEIFPTGGVSFLNSFQMMEEKDFP